MRLSQTLCRFCLVSTIALAAGGALAQQEVSDDAAVSQAQAGAAQDAAAGTPDATETETETATEGGGEMPAEESPAEEVAEDMDEDAAAAAAESAEAEAAEAAAAEARAAAAEAARLAQEAQASEAAARAAELDEFRAAIAALAAEREAEAQAAAEAAAAEARAAAAEAARLAQEAHAAEAAERDAALAEFRASIEALALERQAAARARAALEACVSTAGQPTAMNFPTQEAQAAAIEALRAALPDCRAAAEALPEEGAPFFHMASAAQLAGRHRRAVPLYEQAAENGVAAALTRLGDYHNFGLRPVREDPAQAVAYYRQAAEAGDPAGMATLAFMYRLGRGVERNPAEMVRLMRDAARAGYPFAQYNLAQTYLNGEGLEGGVDADLGLPDARLAVPILVRLARAGNRNAITDLIALYSDGGAGVAADDVRRAAWVSALANTGDPVGIAARGFLLEQGIGRPADPQAAAEAYIAALESGEIDIDDLRGTVGGATPRWERETALAFQTILAERGFYRGLIDGDIGPMSRAAARALVEQVQSGAAEVAEN